MFYFCDTSVFLRLSLVAFLFGGKETNIFEIKTVELFTCMYTNTYANATNSNLQIYISNDSNETSLVWPPNFFFALAANSESRNNA